MAVVTRFAPSPTGMVHIGNARTGLFNWLFARHHGGTFLLRIEDTDRERSTPEATEAIFKGMSWLGLDHDGEAISQFARGDRHRAVALAMLEAGTAYKCFSTQDEIAAFRDTAKSEGRSTLFQSPWRDTGPADHPDLPYVVRLRAPRDGETVVEDAVQGRVTWKNATLDDMILLRSDGTPTYMHAVVVDDHDMGVTHVIRGDDHLANAARQSLVYQANGWDLPIFAHLPLILGPDGKKLSKRHGATSVEEYQKMGYPAAGMRNYLTRLGWSHGDDEFFSDAQARDWFDLDGINKSAARFDFKKLANLCGQHIAVAQDSDLVTEIEAYLAAIQAPALSAGQRDGLSRAMFSLKERAKTFEDLLEKAHFVLTKRPLQMDDKAAKTLDSVSRGILSDLTPHLEAASWNRDTLEAAVAEFASEKGLKLGKIAPALRAALAGRSVTPSVFDMMLVIGQEETLARINDIGGA